MTPEYLTIGHITQDLLPDRSYRPGGTVTFAARAARNLGARAAVLTAGPALLRQDLTYNGIEVRGPLSPTATIFENVYGPEGRTQFVRGVAPVIEVADVPFQWREAQPGPQIVHLGPVAGECAPGLAALFPHALVGLTPQGFMRRWDNSTGQVYPVEWAGAAQLLPQIGALILSTEDLPPGERGQLLLQEYIRLCPLVALTQGPGGCTVFFDGRACPVPAYPATEVDPTGAGDVFAAAFLLRLRATGDPVAAARFANAAAACNIEHPGATGVPTLAQVEARMRQE